MVLKRIRLISGEELLDNGFYLIMTSGESSVCLRNEEYLVTEKVIEVLDRNEVPFLYVYKEEETPKGSDLR